MESRKVQGWRSRLQQAIDEAEEELREFGAETIGARKASSALDFREKEQAKLQPFLTWDVPAGGRRRAAGANKEAKQRLNDLKQELALREGVKSLQYEKRKRWFASMSPQQLADFKEKDRAWRKAYRERRDDDPLRRQRERDLAKARRQKLDPLEVSEYKKRWRLERTQEQRERDAASKRAWREKNKDKVREHKRRARERKKALRNE